MEDTLKALRELGFESFSLHYWGEEKGWSVSAHKFGPRAVSRDAYRHPSPAAAFAALLTAPEFSHDVRVPS